MWEEGSQQTLLHEGITPKFNGPGRYKPRQDSKGGRGAKQEREKRGKTFALKLCVFVTVLSDIANRLFEAFRADSVHLVLNRIGKEVCLLLFMNKTHGG